MVVEREEDILQHYRSVHHVLKKSRLNRLTEDCWLHQARAPGLDSSTHSTLHSCILAIVFLVFVEYGGRRPTAIADRPFCRAPRTSTWYMYCSLVTPVLPRCTLLLANAPTTSHCATCCRPAKNPRQPPPPPPPPLRRPRASPGAVVSSERSARRRVRSSPTSRTASARTPLSSTPSPPLCPAITSLRSPKLSIA